MSFNEVIEILGDDWRRVKILMSEYLHTDVSLLRDTNDSVLGHSGKMMRPMVSLLNAAAIGKVNDDSLRLAAASEILHNASLMHDDVADGSLERRGFPSVMSLQGPSAAILIGDFWLAKAVEAVFDTECQDDVKRLFSKTLCDLSEGEMLQLEKSFTADTSEEDYLKIIYCKTASLFNVACTSGAVSVRADNAMKDAASSYGVALGLAFQIKDDILDYSGTSEMGKPVGVDIREKKITLPLLGAFRNAPEKEAEIRAMIRDMKDPCRTGSEITSYVLDNGGIEYASSVLDSYVRKAEESISVYADSPAKEALVSLARFNAIRQV
ncbi:MAG: polyprenyl synthetase family protein [Bacteroidales bacterium]|nr:polyprenyl synthetase family protein [Bacteroidales bacterium]